MCVRVILSLHEAQRGLHQISTEELVSYMKHSLHEDIRHVFQIFYMVNILHSMGTDTLHFCRVMPAVFIML